MSATRAIGIDLGVPKILAVRASTTGGLLLDPTRKSFARWFYAADRRPDVPVVIARSGVTAGAIGAAVLAMDTVGWSAKLVGARDA
jgi:hypothetical protein